MNTDDRLEDALRAARDRTDGSCPEAARTRVDVLARAAQRSRRKRVWAFVIPPLAAALIASTAWGAVTGRFPRWVDFASDRPARPPAALEEARMRPSASPAVVASVEPSPPPTALAELPAPAPAPAPARAPAPRARSSGPSSEPALAGAPSNDEGALYATAHRAHFVDRDPATALRGWDAYLATHPRGRFAVEARYNRAIALVRLGRREEAAAALAWFAGGGDGGYRQREAALLLEALLGSTPEGAGHDATR